MKTAQEWLNAWEEGDDDDWGIALFRAIQADALESAALTVESGPFAGDREGDAAAIRRLKPVEFT